MVLVIYVMLFAISELMTADYLMCSH